MGEATVFSLFVSPHLDGDGGGQGTPAMSGWLGGTLARSGWWGEPQSGLDGEGYPGQVLMVGGILARSGWWGGTLSKVLMGWVPKPGLDGGGYPTSQVWMVRGYLGYPQPGLDGGGTPHHDWMGYLSFYTIFGNPKLEPYYCNQNKYSLLLGIWSMIQYSTCKTSC